MHIIKAIIEIGIPDELADITYNPEEIDKRNKSTEWELKYKAIMMTNDDWIMDNFHDSFLDLLLQPIFKRATCYVEQNTFHTAIDSLTRLWNSL